MATGTGTPWSKKKNKKLFNQLLLNLLDALPCIHLAYISI